MHRRLLSNLLPLALLLVAIAAAPRPVSATEIWSGRTFSFTKANFADPTQPANQDRITPAVWITRGNTQGIYNIAQETSSSGSLGLSPKGTQWATGDAVNYGSLTFSSWVDWALNNPPSTIGVNAVVHLLAEDIYIDIRFDSWTSGLGGGGFSYTRAVAPVPTAVTPGTWGAIKALYR